MIKAPVQKLHEYLVDDPARVQGHRDLREDVTHDGDDRQVPTGARGVPPFQELGHREDAAPQVEGDEEPSQEQQDQGGEHLELTDRDAAAVAGAGEPHEVLRSDVRREESGADDEPADVPAGQEVALGRLVGRGTAAARPPGHPEDDSKIEPDQDPVERCEITQESSFRDEIDRWSSRAYDRVEAARHTQRPETRESRRAGASGTGPTGPGGKSSVRRTASGRAASAADRGRRMPDRNRPGCPR